MRMFNMGLLAAGALALTASGAAAEIVCNDDGDCWHVRQHAEYRPEFKLHVHGDDWKWKEHEHYRFREHDGHGYWRSGAWVDIR